MKIKRIIIVCMAGVLSGACGKQLSEVRGGGTGIQTQSISGLNPSGMVLIPSGFIELGVNEPEPLWGVFPEKRIASFGAFWMDETEVTNARYRQFVYWVRDSIIRERLADPIYGGDESFKITEDRYGEPVTPHLNWNRTIPWKRPDEEQSLAIESVFITNPVTGVKRLDSKQMNYRFEWYDHAAEALYRNKDIYSDRQAVLITKDTAFIGENGQIERLKISRLYTGYYDFLNTYIVNIYPNETCWIQDFENSRNETFLKTYFWHPDYDRYPVVGVSWDMANAYCSWRTSMVLKTSQIPKGELFEPYRLPTEGEWEYAARAGKSEFIYPWGTNGLMTLKGCYMGNFKPKEGEYTSDGHLTTSRTGTYPPNGFGLYDMAGNVAEWTSTGYNEASWRRTGDLNPDLQLETERKVVKGGSWKDTPYFVRSDVRVYENQHQGRSYIGFRCVRSHTGPEKSRR